MLTRLSVLAAVPVLAMAVALAAVAQSRGAADGLGRMAGKALFDKLWVAAPSSTLASDGLGPLYNARSCAACHRGAGGGALPGSGPLPVGMTVTLGATDAPDPVYGHQIQTAGTAGHRAEARPELRWIEDAVLLADGEVVHLRRPVLTLAGLAQGPLDGGTALSLRIAPPVKGMALIDAIPDTAIRAMADPDDRDGDGISGRVREVGGAVGRFGWKATRTSLRQQVASAFSLDIGLSTPLFPAPWGDCTAAQTGCRAAPDGRGPSGYEVDDQVLDLVVGYLAGLEPAPPVADAEGERLFHRIGCATCHRSDLGTGGARPYSDFLLHDMGPGLADGLDTGRLDGAEWRTAPLWAMQGASDKSPALLHDGRARSVLEAILWHGGEAMATRDTFITLPPDDRAALIRFLEGL